MSFFDDTLYEVMTSERRYRFFGAENDPNFLSSPELNWATLPGPNMASDDSLETPRQDAFQHSLLTQHFNPAAQTLATSPSNESSDNETSSLDGNKPDTEYLSASPNEFTSGPEIPSSPPFIPGPVLSAGDGADDSSSDSSPIKCQHTGHRQMLHNIKQSPGESPKDFTAINTERHVFNFEHLAQRSIQHLPSLPIQFRRPAPTDMLSRPTDPAITFPSFETLMDPINNNADMDTFFSSFEEADAANANATAIPPDPTLPQTAAQRRAIVKALFNAMRSIERAEDNPGMIRPFAEGKYSDVRMETACWHILHACIMRHSAGPLLALYHAKPKQTGEIPTFAERITTILDCLATQKTICKHLLDPFYLHSFCDDPIGARKRVLANKTLNKRKGEVMNAGKQVLGSARTESLSQSVNSEPLEDPFGGVATPSSAVGRGMMGDIDPAITPDTINRRAMKAMKLESSPLGSSPLADDQSLHSFHQGSIFGTSSYDASPNLRQGPSSYGSSPVLSHSPMSLLPHVYARVHVNRMAAPTSAPTSHPAVGVPSLSSPMTQSRIRAGSAASSPSQPVTPGSLTENHFRGRMMPPQTPTRNSKSMGSRNTSTRRKRSTAEMDAVEYSSPEKKTQF